MRALIAALLLLATASALGEEKSAADRAGEKLSALLADKAKERKTRPVVRTLPGPLGTIVVRANVPGSYPGEGVATVVLDEKGASYGVHGDHDVADLVRARGWLKTPPPVDELIRLIGAANYENLLAYDPQEGTPTLKLNGGRLELRMLERTMLGDQHFAVVAVVSPTGALRVDKRPAPAPKK